jgi:GNAT superfamily N-acetyltransferase
MATFSIREFSDELAADFDAINRAWITTMFVVEPHDDQVLSHPREMIVDRGGTILFVADAQGRVLGAGALMLTGGGAIELTKMGVRDAARGSGAGRFLLDALIERARTLAPTPLYLLTRRSTSTNRPASSTIHGSWDALAETMHGAMSRCRFRSIECSLSQAAAMRVTEEVVSDDLG